MPECHFLVLPGWSRKIWSSVQSCASWAGRRPGVRWSPADGGCMRECDSYSSNRSTRSRVGWSLPGTWERQNPGVKRVRNWQLRSGQPARDTQRKHVSKKQTKKEIYNPGYLLHWREGYCDSHTGYLLKACSDRHNLTSLWPETVTMITHPSQALPGPVHRHMVFWQRMLLFQPGALVSAATTHPPVCQSLHLLLAMTTDYPFTDVHYSCVFGRRALVE